jgi:hypothetical protein
MPKPIPGESQKKYVDRCIPIVLKEGTAKDGSQASAICHSMWQEHQKKKAESGWPKNLCIFDFFKTFADWQTFEAAQSRTDTTVQSLILEKKHFPTSESATSWAKKNGFKTETIRETTESWRIRQRPPEDFSQTSFRTISMTTGVSAVVGHLK